MKAIVKIKPAGKSLRRLIRHCYLHEGRQGREVPALRKNGSRVFAVINGLPDGSPTMNPATDAKSLAGGIQDRSQYRHVILSCEDMKDRGQRKNALQALIKLAQGFAKAFAPNIPFLGILHDDRAHCHAHLIFANGEADGQRLSWSRAQVKEMQAMEWVPATTRAKFSIESGRHKGLTRREGSGQPYPLASSLDAKILAQASQEQLLHYEQTKQLTIGRRNKSGEITSIIFNNRRIRLSTIRGIATNSRLDTSEGNSRSARREPTARMVRVRPCSLPDPAR